MDTRVEFIVLNIILITQINYLVGAGTTLYKFGIIEYQSRSSKSFQNLLNNFFDFFLIDILSKSSYIYGPHICGEAIDIDSDHNHLITGSWRKSSSLQVI